MKGKGAFKKGGSVESSTAYNAVNSNVLKEAKEKKRGGKIAGEAGKKRLDRPGRKRGGGVGADMHPLSSAAKRTNAVGHSATEGDASKGS